VCLGSMHRAQCFPVLLGLLLVGGVVFLFLAIRAGKSSSSTGYIGKRRPLHQGTRRPTASQPADKVGSSRRGSTGSGLILDCG